MLSNVIREYYHFPSSRCRLMLKPETCKHYCRKFSVTCKARIDDGVQKTVKFRRTPDAKDLKFIQEFKKDPLLRHAWVENDSEHAGGKVSRWHPVKTPECLSACRPQPGKPVYVHTVQFQPKERKRSASGPTSLLFDLMSSNHNFVILSSKHIPQVCDFSIPTSEDVCLTKLKTNVNTICLTEQQVESVKKFHCSLFVRYLSGVHNFLHYDSRGDGVSYFVGLAKDNLELDWDLMKECGRDILEPNVKVPPLSSFRSESLIHTLIIPQNLHGRDEQRVFIIKHVKRGPGAGKQSPLFCISEFRAPCMVRKEVDSRVITHEHLDDFKLFEFPVSIWIKANLLPATLLMFEYLVGAEELRRDIATKVGIGKCDLASDQQWTPISWSSFIDGSYYFKTPPKVSFEELVHSVYCSAKEWMSYQNSFKTGGSSVKQLPQLNLQRLKILGEKQDCGLGPELSGIQELLTVKKHHQYSFHNAQLGRAFIKLVCVMYMLHAFPNQLSTISSMVEAVSSVRNILYIAQSKQFPEKLRLKGKIDETWLPPSFCVPPQIQRMVVDMQLPPEKLKALHLSPQEQIEGRVPASTMLQFLAELKRSQSHKTKQNEEKSVNSLGSVFLGRQLICDRDVVDRFCGLVELYLWAGGVESALKLLKYMEFLPSEISHSGCVIQFEDVLNGRALNFPCTNKIKTETDFQDVEKSIGYSFNNKYLLEEALHCASYLAVIGDAIHSFLLAAYLQERTSNFLPSSTSYMHASLNSNFLFACLAVRYDMHKAMMDSLDPYVRQRVEDFVAFQNSNNHSVPVYGFSWEPCPSHAEAPKCLADVFEALVGAIYLDCGLNFDKVWCVIHKLLHKELSILLKASPINTRSLTHEARKRLKINQKRINSGQPTVKWSLVVGGKPIHLEETGPTFQDAEQKVSHKLAQLIRATVEKKLSQE